ncbi:J domain-containing protein [Nocardioides caricicola]|uniref:J domain-containing protein n=1 Tax=Nocardioides caricicola TaxID=634770 RepID=A0ABW0N160_9ACTN
MTGSGNPTWYDILGVGPDAPADEIRAAWRAQIADLDPTDRRFSVLNQAAEVLLDPERRAVYDAELAAAAAEPEPEQEPVAEVDTAPAADPAPAPAGGRTIPGWLLAGLAAVTLALVAVTAVVWSQEPSSASVESDTRAAQAAAERAVVPILSYDARNLDTSKAAAHPYLTSDFREEYDKLFDGIIAENAPSTGTVLDATLVSSGVVRAGEDRVQVFALVDQTRTNKKYTEPQVYKNWVTITMEKVDGDWLVASLDT